MGNVINALCIKRSELEMQLERSEDKGGEIIILTKGECEELFEVMLAAEKELRGESSEYAPYIPEKVEEEERTNQIIRILRTL